jgi:hypothetical protein
MSEYKIALFGSGGILPIPYPVFVISMVVLAGGCEVSGGDGRGGQVVVDGTVCVADVDGAI